MQLQHLLDIIAEEAPPTTAARLARRLRREYAAGRLTSNDRPATATPTVDEILAELPRHGYNIAKAADALDTSQKVLRNALRDRLRPPKPRPRGNDLYGDIMRAR